MRLGIGIDFGTTNSRAAVFDGERLALVNLEGGVSIMPSATYIDRVLQAQVGQRAIDCYIAANTGRTVELTPEIIGVESAFVEQGDPEQPSPIATSAKAIYGQPLIDRGLQGRLFRGVKRLLGDAGLRRLMVFDHPFRLVALITPILAHIRTKIAEQVDGEDVRCTHMGHPVHFEGRSPKRNHTALARLGEACRHAGLAEVRYCAEPVAASLRYLHDNPEVEGERLLTVDFGGGTLDCCVLQRVGGRSAMGAGGRNAKDGMRLRRGAGQRLGAQVEHSRKRGQRSRIGEGQFEVLATHGVALGGDRIDQLLFRELLFPLLGKGEIWRRTGMGRDIATLFPFEDYEDLLLNWAVGYTLNQNRYTTAVLDCMANGGAGAEKFERLHQLIRRNLGYLVFQAIKGFKAELSEQPAAVLDIPELDVQVRLTRTEFEALIAEPLVTFAAALDETLAQARIAPHSIDLVLRTGGSCLIPAVQRILAERFPGRVVEQNPFTSVAAGLAMRDFWMRS